MKNIPNILSSSRIVLSIVLLTTKPLSLPFVLIYLICGISDILDGYIARKMQTATNIGARLDSVADLIMIMVLIVLLYPIINPPAAVVVWIGIIALIRIISVITVLIKYKSFAMLHTYGNKITGLILFIFPLSLSFTVSPMVIYVICTIASISAVEELLIQLSSKELQVNRKSIFTQ